MESTTRAPAACSVLTEEKDKSKEAVGGILNQGRRPGGRAPSASFPSEESF